MSKRPYTSYNLYFIIPFVLWIVTGGFLLFFIDGKTLFSSINTHYNSLADIIMYYATWMGEAVTITIVLVLLLLIVPSFRNWWYFITALLCTLVPTFLEQWIKHLVRAPRPLKVFNSASWIHINSEWPKLFNNSFPSGHSTGAFSFFCFLSLLLHQRYKKFGLLFFFLALLVAYSRIYLAAHFFADVYAGSILGTITTLLLFSVMRYYQKYFFKGGSLNTAA